MTEPETGAVAPDPTRPGDPAASPSTGHQAPRSPRARSLVTDSKFLAYVLRHDPGAIGLRLDGAGWVGVESVLTALAAHGRPLDADRLDRLVAGPDKQRFEIHGGRIRAAQGHSIAVDLGLPPAEPPTVLYHGTVDRLLDRILVEGLRQMGRRHVHLSGEPATARAVGARRGRPVVLTVDAAGLHAGGQLFHRAANGVWLTLHVPASHLTVLQGSLGHDRSRCGGPGAGSVSG